MSTDNLQQAIANAVAGVRATHPDLRPADETEAYHRYRRHFAEREEDPPTSERPAEDDLLLAIWDVIVDRETAHSDQPDGKLEDYYAAAFTALLDGGADDDPTHTPIAVSPSPEDTAGAPAPVEKPKDEKVVSNMEGEQTAPEEEIYRIRVVLDGSKPEIWRRLLVPRDVRQTQLHHYIQAAMGWPGTDTYQFTPAEKLNVQRIDEPKLGDIVDRENPCGYEFDNWYHHIELEDTEPAAGNRHYPVCTAGQRACPPADVGGVKQYNEMVENLQDPTHPDYETMAGWLTQDFNPAAFNIEQANLRLGQKGDAGFRAVK